MFACCYFNMVLCLSVLNLLMYKIQCSVVKSDNFLYKYLSSLDIVCYLPDIMNTWYILQRGVVIPHRHYRTTRRSYLEGSSSPKKNLKTPWWNGMELPHLCCVRSRKSTDLMCYINYMVVTFISIFCVYYLRHEFELAHKAEFCFWMSQLVQQPRAE